MPVDMNDPKMADYVPIGEIVVGDADQSSDRIRDIPADKLRHSLEIFPAQLAFASVDIDQITSPQTLLLRNNGFETVKIASITPVGPFQITGDVPKKILSGETIAIQVTFTPETINEATGGVYVDTGDAGGQEFIKFTGSIGDYLAGIITDDLNSNATDRVWAVRQIREFVTSRSGGFKTKAEAASFRPGSQVPFFNTAYLDDATVIGSGASYGLANPNSDPGTADAVSMLRADGINRDWYVIKDPVLKVRSISSNDDVAIATALQISKGRPIDFGGHTYTLRDTVSLAMVEDLVIRGDDSRINFDPIAHKQAVLSLTVGGSRRLVDIQGIDLSAGAKANRGLEIINTTVSMADANLADVHISGRFGDVRRSAALTGGDAVLVQGGFKRVHIENCYIHDCTLPAGAGTPGTIGIRGIGVTQNSGAGAINGYPLQTIIERTEFRNISSEDLDYAADQDGLAVFSPFTAAGNVFLPTSMTVEKCRFINCFGRAIKSQVYDNAVRDNYFERNTGLNNNSNPDIDFQISGGEVSGNEFYYNGKGNGTIFQASNGSSVSRTSAVFENNMIRSAASERIGMMVQTFPSQGLLGQTIVRGNRVLAPGLEHAVSLYCNGNRNFLTFEDNFFVELQPSTVLNVTPDVAAIIVRANGGVTPYMAFIDAARNRYLGVNTAALVRDNIAGVSMQTVVNTPAGNVGFASNRLRRANESGLKTDQIARLGRIGPIVDTTAQVITGFFEPFSTIIAAGETKVLNFRAAGGILMLTVDAGVQAQAMVALGASLVSIYAGTSWNVGATAEPATGTYRVWRSNADEISIKNTSASGRNFTVFHFSAT